MHRVLFDGFILQILFILQNALQLQGGVSAESLNQSFRLADFSHVVSMGCNVRVNGWRQVYSA